MKGIQSNGFLPIIAQAIAEMEELHGEFAGINEINLAELGRRTGISRAKLRRLKANGFCETPHGLIQHRALRCCNCCFIPFSALHGHWACVPWRFSFPFLWPGLFCHRDDAVWCCLPHHRWLRPPISTAVEQSSPLPQQYPH